MARHTCASVRRCSAVGRLRSGSVARTSPPGGARPAPSTAVDPGENEEDPMAGAMRKMGIYLGLVEDEERRGELAEYEEYDEYGEAEVVPARRERYSRGGWDDVDS